jgi:hypothetical protein
LVRVDLCTVTFLAMVSSYVSLVGKNNSAQGFPEDNVHSLFNYYGMAFRARFPVYRAYVPDEMGMGFGFQQLNLQQAAHVFAVCPFLFVGSF